MIDERELLERAARFAPTPGDVLGALARRRAVKQRRRRIGTAVVALVVATAAIGLAIGAFRNAGRRTPASPSGSVAWTRQLPMYRLMGVAADGSGTYAVGEDAGGGGEPWGVFAAFQRDGAMRWREPLPHDYLGEAVAVDPTGVYVAGWRWHENGAQGFVARFDHDGNLGWLRTIDQSAERTRVFPSDLVVSNGRVVVGGTILHGALPGSASRAEGAFVAAYEPNGTPLWDRQFAGAQPVAPFGGVAADGSGVYVSRNGPGHAYRLDKLDWNGSSSWTAQLPAVVGRVATGEGIVALLTAGHVDAFRPDGSMLWSTAIAHAAGYGSDIAIGSDGVIAAFGVDLRSLPPGKHPHPNTTLYVGNILAARLGLDGDVRWTRTFDSTVSGPDYTDDVVNAVAVSGDRSFVAGSTTGSFGGHGYGLIIALRG